MFTWYKFTFAICRKRDPKSLEYLLIFSARKHINGYNSQFIIFDKGLSLTFFSNILVGNHVINLRMQIQSSNDAFIYLMHLN